jgi:putative membrane protein
MNQITDAVGRIARRMTILTIPVLAVASGTVAAHSGGSYGGGMMGGGWGLFGGTMGLWGLLWMGLLIAIPVYLAYALLTRNSDSRENRPLSVLRERYARGELSEEEFEQRRTKLEQTG